MSRCLNKLQTGRPTGAGGEVAGFVELVRLATHTEPSRTRFLGVELRDVSALSPPVMDHAVLQRHDYRPGSEIGDGLVSGATVKHRKLASALQRLDEGRTREAEDQVIKRSAELLYVVRSNIAHGEKAPYGPDLTKRERDEAVCKRILPLSMLLVDLLLAQPSRRLVAYGTLAPGEASHSVLDSLAGEWTACEVCGYMTYNAGLPVMSWTPGRATVMQAMMLDSDDLPAAWEWLDTFEGPGYRRWLVPVSVRHEDGSRDGVVASIYVGASSQGHGW